MPNYTQYEVYNGFINTIQYDSTAFALEIRYKDGTIGHYVQVPPVVVNGILSNPPTSPNPNLVPTDTVAAHVNTSVTPNWTETFGP